MKQLFIRNRHPVVLEVPEPLLEPGNVLVAVAYSLISTGTEISGMGEGKRSAIEQAISEPQKVLKAFDYLKRQGLQRTIAKIQGNLADSTPVGYSCAGTVVQIDTGINDLQIGDFVACGGAGKANHAEWVVVPRNLVVPVPRDVDLRAAASTTIGAIALQGVRRADLRLGEWTAVIGLGLLGQITAQLLRSNGVRVIGFDMDSRRVEVAKSLGMPHGFVPSETDPLKEVFHLTEGHGVDATIITAASKSDEIVQQAMELSRKQGRVVIVGAVGLGLKRSPFYEKEIDLLIARSYGPGRYDPHYEEQGLDYPYGYVRWTENRNMAEYLRLLSEKQVNFDALVEAEYPLNEAEQAYAALQQQENRPIAVVLHYPDAPQRLEPSAKRITLRSTVAKQGIIRLALVGAGEFARGMHLPNLQALSNLYQLKAVVDLRGGNARDTAEHYGASYFTTEYTQVLTDPEIDMVLIATRHSLHSDQAIQAAQAGKAVFVEKPMAIDEEALDRLLAVLKETGVPYMVGFNRRFSPAAWRAKAILNNLPGPYVILYRVNAGYIPKDHWVHSPEGGGRIIGEACHMFDLFQYLVGPACITEVTSTSLVPGVEHLLAADNVSATIRYENGSFATLLYTALGASELGKEYIEIYANGKVLVIDDFRSLNVYGSREKGWKSTIPDKGHFEELKEFARYVRGESQPPISLDEMAETTRVSLLVAKGG